MELSFQKIILVIAALGLVIILIVIGMSLAKSKTTMVWPPITAACPDYWIDLKGDGESCFNSKSLGRCNLPQKGDKNTMNFNVSPFNADNGTCSKYTWANRCGVTWDGITYGVENPCSTDTTTTTTTSS
jgi:hypothetical protein